MLCEALVEYSNTAKVRTTLTSMDQAERQQEERSSMQLK